MRSTVYMLFWLPTIIFGAIRAVIEPRATLRYTYRPASDQARNAENEIRNKARLASYYAKRTITKDTND